jgi:hypothetical protein
VFEEPGSYEGAQLLSTDPGHSDFCVSSFELFNMWGGGGRT